jgi:thiol-disulfide isomerase/thioredoxin
MKRVALIACCAALGIVGCSPADFHSQDGVAGHYRDWRGKWVVINYWAEWCAPCRQEIPELNGLWANRDPNRLVVVGVNFDGVDGEDLVALVAKMQIAYPVIVGAPGEHWGYPTPSVLPTSVLIGPDGAVAATLVGPQSRASLEAAMSAPPKRSAPAREGSAGG